MDKYEFNIKAEQMRKMADQGDYKTAMQIADTIDWRRVRNANLLSSVAEIYEYNKEYEEAKDILLLAFERAPVGKRFLFKLAEISVKAGDIQEAQEFYREFCDMSPDDSRQYLLRYMILKAKGASSEQLIAPLEEYVSIDVDEKWLFELAKLYSDAGYVDECVKICDKIMLMFGLGQYVDKAMELKQKYRSLSEQQKDLVENKSKYEEKLRKVSQQYNDTDKSINSNIYDNTDISQENTQEYVKDSVPDEVNTNEAKVDLVSDRSVEIAADEKQTIEINDVHIKNEEPVKVDLNNYHMIIEARTKADGLKIAVDEIKYFHDKYGYDFKVAKTNSDKLNEKGFDVFKSKIEGKDLIIEDAGSLTYDVIDEIEVYIDTLNDASSIVLVDTVDRFDRMAEDRPLFIKKFDLVSDIEEDDLIEDVELDVKESDEIKDNKDISVEYNNTEENEEMPIPEEKKVKEVIERETRPLSEDNKEALLPADFYKEMNIDDFATYAQEYAKQIDCVLPGKTVLALYERIEIMQEDGIALTKASAEELIEEAADKAEKPGIGKKLTGVFHPKYDKEDRLILRVDCFIN